MESKLPPARGLSLCIQRQYSRELQPTTNATDSLPKDIAPVPLPRGYSWPTDPLQAASLHSLPAYVPHKQAISINKHQVRQYASYYRPLHLQFAGDLAD